MRRRALKSIVTKPKGRHLAHHFLKWLAVTNEFHYAINSNIRILMIKVFRRSLQSAFDRWKVSRNEAFIEKQSVMIAQYKKDFRKHDNETVYTGQEITLSSKRVLYAARLRFRHIL